MSRIGEIVFVCALWLLAAPVLAVDVEQSSHTRAAIESLLEPGNRLTGDQIAEVSEALDLAAEQSDIPVLLLVSMAHHETRFRGHLVGSIGERGILQVHGVARRGCALDTVEQQAQCGARWLRSMIDHCGSLESGLAAYAVGRCQVAPESRAARAVRRRLKLWGKLEKEFGTSRNDDR